MLENEAKIRTDKLCVMVSVCVGFRSGPNQHEPEMRERRESMEGVCVCLVKNNRKRKALGTINHVCAFSFTSYFSGSRLCVVSRKYHITSATFVSLSPRHTYIWWSVTRTERSEIFTWCIDVDACRSCEWKNRMELEPLARCIWMIDGLTSSSITLLVLKLFSCEWDHRTNLLASDFFFLSLSRFIFRGQKKVKRETHRCAKNS